MDAPGTMPESINCHQCDALIDLAGQQAFTHVECPWCGALSVVPLKFGNFLLLNALGIGGMGTVYRAIDLSQDRYLAVKILRKNLAGDPRFIENFAREARTAASLNHPNLRQVYSFGEQDGQYYLTMELLEHGSLDDRITRLGKLPEKDVLEIGAQIADGLRTAHQSGLLHRDIKPGNILFNDEGIPKLADFGLAGTQHEVSVETGLIWGTPYYVAPEKLRGQPEDFRSDLYSLGASLFHALAGRPPFDAKTTSEVVAKHTTTPALSLKSLAPDVQEFTAQVIGRMLAKNPAERFETYDALIHDLHEAVRLLREARAALAIVTEAVERVSIASQAGTVAALLVCVGVFWYVVIHRTQLGSKFAPSERPASTGATPKVMTTALESKPAEEVDFNSDEAWVKSWRVATLELTQSKFNEALSGYDRALSHVGRSRQRPRQWIYFYEAISLMVTDRFGEARKLLAEKAKDPGASPRVPQAITVGNFVNPLVAVLLDELPLQDFSEAVPKLPPWAAGLAQLSMAFKHLETGAADKARDAFRAYHNMPVDETERWAFNLQPLADKLARDCDRAATVLAEIEKLESQQKFDAALTSLDSLAKNTRLPVLKAALAIREARLQRDAKEFRQRSEQSKQKE